MMQKWSLKLLRPFLLSPAEGRLSQSLSRRVLHSFSPSPGAPSSSLSRPVSNLAVRPPSPASSQLKEWRVQLQCPFTAVLMTQTREFASKERRRTPVTPVTSKVKKIKMKSYSSFKDRFRTLKNGEILRWRAGKRHNAHSKSKKAKRRLRKPAIVHAAYAKVMKKLNFCG